MPDFLLEIGCDEIPARMIDAASLELRERLYALFERERLTPAGTITYLDTPRRLAFLASGVPASQPDITEQVSGPSAQISYNDGQPAPTPALSPSQGHMSRRWAARRFWALLSGSR